MGKNRKKENGGFACTAFARTSEVKVTWPFLPGVGINSRGTWALWLAKAF